MKIINIEIRSFRNITFESFLPNPVLNGFWGENGQGKTNFLEALFATIKGESFRPYCAKSDWLPNQALPHQPSRIHLFLEDSRGYQSEILLHYSVNKRWEVLLNGKKTQFTKVRTKIPLVVFSPDDHVLIRGAPENRRAFMDELFSDTAPGYGEILGRYNRALKQRNELLKKMRRQELYNSQLLEGWTKVLAKEAVELWKIREELWPELKACFLKVSEEIFGGKLQDIDIHYTFNHTKESPYSLNTIYDDILADFKKDIATGWTHKGPHRDDFLIELEKAAPARSQASQSQARLLALALKWTHAEFLKQLRNEPGIFIIDDLSSELDASHRELLFSRIIKHSGQIFLSGTEHSLVDLKDFSDYKYLKVREGSLTQINHGKNTRRPQSDRGIQCLENQSS